jgi:hypothetical protein
MSERGAAAVRWLVGPGILAVSLAAARPASGQG